MLSAGVYFIQRGRYGAIKIGFSSNAQKRLAQLQTSSETRLRIIGVIAGDKTTEKDLHRRFARQRMSGEWFNPIDELRDFIHEQCGTTLKTKPTTWTGGTPLSDEIAAKLRVFITQHDNDAKRVSEILDIPISTIIRGAAGANLRKGSRVMIEHALAAKAA